MARARMESIQLKLQQGIAFADLAAEYGEGDAVLTDGDIGYVDPESLPEELRTVAKALPSMRCPVSCKRTARFGL